MPITADELHSNLGRVREKIAAAAQRAGRAAADVGLVAITKTVPAETVALAAAAGVTAVGENRTQEAAGKIAEVRAPLAWHMVGRLQTNKARDAVRWFELVHSLDRFRLAEALNRAAESAGKPCRVLVQVNVTGASSQGGVAPEGSEGLIEKAARLPYLRMCGLMAIGPYPGGDAEIRSAYRSVSAMFRRLASQAGPEFVTLSLGMSGDYEIAIEEGSTLVRVGTAIFGERR